MFRGYCYRVWLDNGSRENQQQACYMLRAALIPIQYLIILHQISRYYKQCAQSTVSGITINNSLKPKFFYNTLLNNRSVCYISEIVDTINSHKTKIVTTVQS